MDCNIEIVSGFGRSGEGLLKLCDSCPLINTPLQRGDLWSADLGTVSTVSLHSRRGKTVETVSTDERLADTQLKLGLNEKLLSDWLLQVTSSLTAIKQR